MENWSFDGQFRLFPGANGITNAGETIRQVRKDGSPYTRLPQPLFNGQPDRRMPADLPVRPFDLAPYVPPDQLTGNPVHLFYQEQYQINGGRMDKFVAWNDAGGDHGGLAMSYYDVTDRPLGQLARQYALCDNFFHSAFGGSWLNHMWLISARTPYWPEAPRDMIAQLDAQDVLIPGTRQDAEVTPDGYAVNTLFSTHPPLSGEHPRRTAPAAPGGPDDRGPAQRARCVLGLVRWRLERCRGRSPRPVVSIPPSALRLLRPLRARHTRAGTPPQG
jgi:acid phosphatase